MRPSFAYQVQSFTHSDIPAPRLFERTVELAQATEEAGFDAVYVMDHVYQIPIVGAAAEPMLEAYTALAALARETTRVQLAALVTGVTYRNPALLAKTVTTLDIVSGGRAILGIGAAWYEAEHRAYGFDFPPVGERMDRLDEALTIIRAMFTAERPSFTGTYYRIEEALNVPRPVRPGGPPILVGGTGERRTLRIAATHADMTHWFALSLPELAGKTAVLERHCEAIGRDPSTIRRTMTSPVLVAPTEREASAIRAALPPARRESTAAGTPEQMAPLLRPYVEAGVTGFSFSNVMLPTPSAIAAAGELLRLLS
jgi:F420-dependent oxidoreductase-like protein